MSVSWQLTGGGGGVPKRGEMQVGFLAQERHRCKLLFQVAAVKRPLLAVSTLTKAGNDVSFHTTGGAVVSQKTRRVIAFAKRGGVYTLDILVPPGGVWGGGAKPSDGGSLAALGKYERVAEKPSGAQALPSGKPDGRGAGASRDGRPATALGKSERPGSESDRDPVPVSPGRGRPRRRTCKPDTHPAQRLLLE